MEKRSDGPLAQMTRRDLLSRTANAVPLATAATAFAQDLNVGPRRSKKLRIGVVGGGFNASYFWHLHPDCVVTGVSDLREDRRKILVNKYDCNKVYEEFHPMLRDPAGSLRWPRGTAHLR